MIFEDLFVASYCLLIQTIPVIFLTNPEQFTPVQMTGICINAWKYVTYIFWTSHNVWRLTMGHMGQIVS